jgi:hydroxymethylpyrimidine/phosphomethylpyrimidine kinase
MAEAATNPPPVLLTIAGFDPSAGAGIAADLKVFAAHGCYGIACITALTVQSTVGVRRVQPVSGGLVSATLQELAGDFDIAAVKIGMLGSAEVAQAVREFLGRQRPMYCVLDPVLRASDGTELLDEAGEQVLRHMLPLVSVITPNRAEAAELSGVAVADMASARSAAAELHSLGARAVVITGGDAANSAEAADLLSIDDGGKIETREYTAPRIQSRSRHGTGCAFSSAVAAHLALGAGLPEAVARAKRYVREAILNAPTLGHGAGPLQL